MPIASNVYVVYFTLLFIWIAYLIINSFLNINERPFEDITYFVPTNTET